MKLGFSLSLDRGRADRVSAADSDLEAEDLIARVFADFD